MLPLHTISLFVANKPGVLLRITLLFSRRGFNIESLVVSSAMDGAFSRMTITAKGDEKVLEQIVKQLGKLVDVIDSRDNSDSLENTGQTFGSFFPELIKCVKFSNVAKPPSNQNSVPIKTDAIFNIAFF